MRLSKRQSVAWNYLLDDTTEEVFYGGAGGGGKTTLGCTWQIDRRVRYPGTHGLIGRKVLKELKNSTLLTFFNCCAEMGYRDGVDYKYYEQKGRVDWANKSITFLLDLDYKPSDPDIQSVGSTFFTDAFIDEASEIMERMFIFVNSRIRYKLDEIGLPPKLLACSNPQPEGWVKRRYIKEQDGSLTILKPFQKFVQAKLGDNPDPAFRAVYQRQLEKLDPYDRARLLDGDWDVQPRTGMEYYHSFNRDIHIGTPKVNNELHFHLTYDFNISPFITLLVVQIFNDGKLWHVNVVDEICLPHPRSQSDIATKEFIDRYPDSRIVFYYGDYTGKSRKTSSPLSDFGHIEKVLAGRLVNNSDRVIPNKHVGDRQRFVQAILENKLPIKLLIHERCKNLIREFQFMKQAPDGGKLTEFVKDPITLGKYEKWGHPTDGIEYLLTSAFIDYFRNYVRR